MGMFIKERLSKNVQSWDSIVTKVDDIQSKREDLLISNVSQSVKMEADGTLSIQRQNLFRPGTINADITDWALNQFSSKIGMRHPGTPSWLKETGDVDLAADLVNRYIERKEKGDVLLRLYDGNVDAAFTNRYSAFDSNRILEVIEDTVNLNDYDLKGTYVSDERLHLRLIGKDMLHINGEDLFPAIIIDSSDVGRAVITVRPAIWKQVCTNGLCIEKAGGKFFEQKHWGITEREIEDELSHNLRKMPQMISAAEAIIKQSINDKLDLTDADEKLAMDNLIANHLRLGKRNRDAVLNKLYAIAIEKYDATKWGIVNAITEYAQEMELDRRFEMEQIAGSILTAKVA